MPDIKYAQTEAVDKGSLKVEVLTNRTRRPIEGARITISYSGDPDSTVEEVSADDSGMSEKLTLDAPPLEYSMEPSENQPFAQYTVKVTAPGYRPVSISGVQVFSEQLALQQVRMAEENEEENQIDSIVIPVNTLFGNFPAKIAESEIKPVSDSGEIVLSKVVIPEFVVVHDGPPSESQCGKLLCPLPGLHQKCGIQRDIQHVAGQHAACQYPCNHVLYVKQGLHGMVPEQRL